MATVQFDSVSKRFRGNVLAVDDFNLEVNEGEFLILVGPSGCGKTTVLRMLAGLEKISDGKIRIGERVVNDLLPSERDIAMVFQNYALYPHMSIFENIAFPLQQQKLRKQEIRHRVTEVAGLLGIQDFLARRPRQLSGGQRQRVAIGRALVRRPQAFLMDEPLSNLDAKLRVQMRAELIGLHHRIGITTIYVTHDQTEAMTLGDRVVVMNDGIAQQIGRPVDLYRHPANTFVAGFVGSPSMNFFVGDLEGGDLQLGEHLIALPEWQRQRLSRTHGRVVVGLRPEDFDRGNNGSGISAEIQIIEHLGPEVLVHLRCDGIRVADGGKLAAHSEDRASAEFDHTVVARFDRDFSCAAGDVVELKVIRERLQLFDPDSGTSLIASSEAPSKCR